MWHLYSTSQGITGDTFFFQFPYHLHAVLVHEGQAASGHYWAYIHDSCRDQWLKFNDITVSEASWEELEKESVGGYHNASAYCLMYVDKTRIMPESGEFYKGHYIIKPLMHFQQIQQMIN